jgi:hypothetical protein
VALKFQSQIKTGVEISLAVKTARTTDLKVCNIASTGDKGDGVSSHSKVRPKPLFNLLHSFIQVLPIGTVLVSFRDAAASLCQQQESKPSLGGFPSPLIRKAKGGVLPIIEV